MSTNDLISTEGSETKLQNGYGYGYPAAIDVDAADGGAALSLSFVKSAFRRWWKLCLPIGLVLAVGCSLAVFFLKKPEYQSDAWLQILSVKPTLAFQAGSLENRAAMSRFRSTQAQLIKSPVILHPVLDKLDVEHMDELPPHRDQQIEWLREKINVASPSDSELFIVSYTSPTPEMAQSVVKEVVTEYMNYKRDVERGQRDAELLRILEEEQEKHRQAKERIQKEIRVLFGQVYPNMDRDVFDESGLGLVQANPLAVLEAKRLDTLMQKAIMERELRELQLGIDEDPSPPPQELVDAALESDQRMITKNLEVEEAKRVYEDALAKAPDLPVVERLKSTWNSKQDELDRLRSELRPEIEATMLRAMKAETKSQRTQRIADLTSSLRNFEEYESVLEGQIDDKQEELKKLGEARLELQEANRQLEIEDNVLNRLTMEQTELQTERGAPEQVKLVHMPLLPSESISSPWPYIVIVSVLGLCVPFGLTIGWEFLTRRVSTSSDLKGKSSLNVIGEITQFPSRRLTVDSELDGTPVYEESIDQICATLMYSPQTEHMRVFGVCSAISGEGKTSVAAQLAMSFARSCSERVLLIDGDLRDPDLAHLFNIEEAPGLVDVLTSRCSPREAIVTDWGHKLHLLPAGILTERPHSLFGQGRFQAVLKELAAGYDYVVVDTPPVLCASEALAISRAVDGVLICSMRDKSRTAQVAAAANRVRDAGAKLVGCVLSGIPKKQYLNQYGTYARAYAVDSLTGDDADDWDEPADSV